MFTLTSKVPYSPLLRQLPNDIDRSLQEYLTQLEDVLREHAAAINGSDVWEDIGYDSGSFPLNPIGAVAAPVRDDTLAGFPGTLLFSGSADNIIANSFQMPHAWSEGVDIYPHIHWTKPAGGGTGVDVTWEWYYRVYVRGAAPTAWIGPIVGTVVVSANGIAEAEAITTFGPITMTGYGISQNIAWQLFRRGSTDAFAGTARLIQFDVHYSRNSSGSKREYVK